MLEDYRLEQPDVEESEMKILKDIKNIRQCIRRGYATDEVRSANKKLLAWLHWYVRTHHTEDCSACKKGIKLTESWGASVGILYMMGLVMQRWMLNAYYGDL